MPIASKPNIATPKPGTSVRGAPVTAQDFPLLRTSVSRRSKRSGWYILGGFAAIIVVLLWGLLSYRPGFYRDRLDNPSPAERSRLSKQFLLHGTRLFNDVQNNASWSADFEEQQINAWLAEDFQTNHAEHSLPAGVSEPRVAIEGGMLKLGFLYTRGPIQAVIQIGFRAWVPKRNMLAVEMDGAWAGALPLPTSQTRHVIHQFANANNLSVTWKRNRGRLVAIFEFPRSPREVILQKVELHDNILHVRGKSSRLPINADYSPSAN